MRARPRLPDAARRRATRSCLSSAAAPHPPRSAAPRAARRPKAAAEEDGNGALESAAENAKSSWSFLSNVLPQSLTPKYITSQWSVAQFHTPGTAAAGAHTMHRTVCAFGPERHTLIVISTDGSFYKCSFDPAKGGECRRESFARYLQVDDDDYRAAD